MRRGRRMPARAEELRTARTTAPFRATATSPIVVPRSASRRLRARQGISPMNQANDEIDLLLLPLVLLPAAVVSVPLARLLRLSPIVAYLTAGVVLGPVGGALFPGPPN